MKHTKATKPRKSKSEYIFACIASSLNREILEAIFYKAAKRPKEVYAEVSQKLAVSINIVSVYLNRMFKQGILSKNKDEGRIAVFYSIEKDTQALLDDYLFSQSKKQQVG